MAKRRSGPGFFGGLIVGIAIGAAVTLILSQPSETPTKPSAAGEGEAEAGASATATKPSTEDPLTLVAGRVRERYQDALIQGREAYERARAEVLQMYNQARIPQ